MIKVEVPLIPTIWAKTIYKNQRFKVLLLKKLWWIGNSRSWGLITIPSNCHKNPSSSKDFGCFEITLPGTNQFVPLRMDGWKNIVSFWDGATCQARTVSFRVGTWFKSEWKFPTCWKSNFECILSSVAHEMLVCKAKGLPTVCQETYMGT